MEYESKIDISLPNKDSKNIKNSNYLEYLQIWIKSLDEDIESFYTAIGNKNLFDIDLTIEELSSMISILENWFKYVGNYFSNISNEMVSSKEYFRKTIQLIFMVCRQIHGNLVYQLDELNKATYGKYFLSYIGNISDKMIVDGQKNSENLTGKISE